MTLRPCLECGLPTQGTTCPEHAPHRTHTASATARGYDQAWQRLSRRARRLQPFCSDCDTVEDLTVDHSEQAWQRHAQGLEIRLEDVEVVCRSCNGKRGRARPTPSDPASTAPGPLGKPQVELGMRTVLTSEEVR